MIMVLLPFLLVIIASYPLMRWAGYDRAGSLLFALCSPLVFGITGGAVMIVGEPFSLEVVSLMKHLGHPDAISKEQADLYIAACGYITGFTVIAWCIRRENEKDTAGIKGSGR
jgi:hypothetical protein